MTTSAAAATGRRRAVSSADANRFFSRVLREVRGGATYVVTAHGRPVATIAPIEKESAVESAARAALFGRLAAQKVVRAGSWTRDELYKR